MRKSTSAAQRHARRSQIAEGYRAGIAVPRFLSSGVAFTAASSTPDGQQRDEVYIWGSFLQSRMYHAGVTCSDCHEPHGQRLRAQGNQLCSTCHLASKYDNQSHHHHAREGAGMRCVDCHMRATAYMVIDPRRDHSFRVPRPDLTASHGTPNACNGCHRNTDAKWAMNWMQRWYGHQPTGFQRYAEAFSNAERGLADAGPSLARIAGDLSHPAIARASALETLERYPARASAEAAHAALADNSALVRRAGVSALNMLLPAYRLPTSVAPLLNDPVRTVRLEAAHTLADAMDTATATQRAAFDLAAVEFEAAQRFNADQPEARAALGNFYARQRRFSEAQCAFAVPSRVLRLLLICSAYVNLADLLRVQDRDAEAEKILRDGLRHAPDAAVVHHTLGLTLVRLKRNEEALTGLERATKLAPTDARFAYVYAVRFWFSPGQSKAAIAEISRALKRHPTSQHRSVRA